MSIAIRIIVLLVLFVGFLGAAPAHTETINCTSITTIPWVITTQGVHCFSHDLTTNMSSGNAIDIQTNNVILDLNGFKLGGLAAGPGTSAIGIFADNRQNITIKNGTIRADQNTLEGFFVQGAGVIIRNNQVVATGGSTFVGLNANAVGIFVEGTGPRVLNNDVIHTFKQGTGKAWGILLNDANGGLVVNNRITQADHGIEYFGSSIGKYRDNLTFDITTPFSGGTDAGNNS